MISKRNNLPSQLFLLLFLFVHQLIGQTEIPKSKHYNLEKLSDGIYAAIHNDDGGFAICNGGIIDLGDRTIVIDPFITPTAARDLKKHAEILTGRPVSLVINTHCHDDHTRGNQVFVPGADIIGTPDTRRSIERDFYKAVESDKEQSPKELLNFQKWMEQATNDERKELKMWCGYHQGKIESFPELKMTLPNITITDTMTIWGTNREIVLIPTGIGHSKGDMIAYLPSDSIIFMGDLLFVERHPFMGGGDPASWKKTLKKIALLKPKIAVPGHGPVGDTNSIHVLIKYIDTLTEMVNEEIKKGTDEDKISELPIPEEYQSWWFSGFYKWNTLKTLYKIATAKANKVQ
jgi:cyclase